MMPALYLDRLTRRYKRQKRRGTYLLIAFFFGLISTVGPKFGIIGNEAAVRICVAIASFAFGTYIWKSLLEAMHMSLYARAQKEGKDYWTAFARQYTIFKLPFAREVFSRLGVSEESLPRDISGNGEDFTSFVTSIFTDNQEFRSILEKNNITKAHWIGAWSWLEKREREDMDRAYMLDAAHVTRMPSIGEAFSYGQTFMLARLGRESRGLSLPQSLDHFYARAFDLLEQSLKKSQGANVIIVSQSVEDGEEYVRAFIPHMQKKKFIELDSQTLISIKDPLEFEKMFTKVLGESARAGNIILVIPHIASIIAAAHGIGYDAALTLAEYMKSPELHIIMIADRYQFHVTLETNVSLIQASNKIELDALAPEILQNIAESEVMKTEYEHGVTFSYQALFVITDAVIRYGSEHMHDALRDYLDECAIFAKKHGVETYIKEATAKKYIAEKTGTKDTFVDATTKTGPANIQEILSRRVKGQEAAVQAVATALERVKAGLGSVRRPLGTFLFLGPTGVGKTETAKALAEAYFGSEDKIVRFDMSEFSDAGALTRLIGSFELGEAGMLAIKAKDAAHGVMLFDEIEKAHEKVHDLMLQILDEGYFTDARGNKVNMKNFIMIATSNAGGAEIFEAGSRDSVPDKNTLVRHIIERGIFKPEFLNRFDEIAVFNPLGDRQLASIASIKLAAYADELYKKKTIHMNVTPALVEFVMNHVENKAFGGRDIQRAIQNYIESIIAKDILSGAATSGSTVTFGYNKEENRLATMYT